MIGIFNTILIQNLKLNAFMPNYSHLPVFAYNAEMIAEIWKSEYIANSYLHQIESGSDDRDNKLRKFIKEMNVQTYGSCCLSYQHCHP